MSAEPQRKHSADIGASAAAPDAEPSWRQGVVELPQPFRLDSGEILANAKLAWQCVGPSAAPLVIALGGISAHRRVCAPGAKGWWEAQCGDGRTLDTQRYRVLSVDWLGGCDESTGPRSYETTASREARQSLPLPCAAGEGKGWGPAETTASREARQSLPLPCAAGEGKGWGPAETTASREARQSLPLPCAAGEGKGWGPAETTASREARPSLLRSDAAGQGDEPQQEFPTISTADQARALLVVLNRLGVRRVHLLVGASYGGNVAQQLAALLGDRLRRLVLLSAAHRPAQFGVALRHIQRSILDLGNASPQALALARELAVLCYRSTEGVERRFADGDERGGVTGWLRHHGEKFSARFNTTAYRCLGRSLDRHCIDPAAIRVPTTVFAVREDLTVPLSLLHEYVAHAGGPCELVEISSAHGHDAFLKEAASVSRVLSAALEATP